jgi:excisionase family DNA binding protein
MMSQDTLLTVKEVAARLGMCQNTVIRLIDDKKLRASRLSPRKIRISQRDLDTYLKKTWTMPVAA